MFVVCTVNMALLRRWWRAYRYPSTPSSSRSAPRLLTPPLSSPSCRCTASTPAGASVTYDSPASRILRGGRWALALFSVNWVRFERLVYSSLIHYTVWLQILTFKEISWQMIRIEADAIQSAAHEMLSAPIRLITNQSKIRVTLKRRVRITR